jgi:threonylcarbamoyladenosine tRNA methylthiotransferase MtaB
MKKISFYTQGCRLNRAETAMLDQSIRGASFEVVPFKEKADIVVINTCTVTEKVDVDTRRLINKIRKLNPETKIALIGCQSQIFKEELLKLPGVKWVIGNEDKQRLSDILSSTNDTNTGSVIVSKIERKPFKHKTIGIDADRTRANVKIQEGCDNYCTFCIIPYARGPARSREFDDILNETKELVNYGYKEIVLTGINLGLYSYNDYDLIDVLSALSEIKGLERIRLSSIEPDDMLEKVIYQMAKNPKICPFLHVPLQSGCNSVLKRMGRKKTCSEYENYIKMAKSAIPRLCIGSDIIVGFPGETEDEFMQTVEFLEKQPLSYLHIFSYSNRKLAKSASFPNQISLNIIKKRSQYLRQLSLKKRTEYLSYFLGRTESVLFEECKQGFWVGLTDTYIRVKLKNNKSLKNQILPVKLVEIDDQSLFGILQE